MFDISIDNYCYESSYGKSYNMRVRYKGRMTNGFYNESNYHSYVDYGFSVSKILEYLNSSTDLTFALNTTYYNTYGGNLGQFGWFCYNDPNLTTNYDITGYGTVHELRSNMEDIIFSRVYLSGSTYEYGGWGLAEVVDGGWYEGEFSLIVTVSGYNDYLNVL